MSSTRPLTVDVREDIRNGREPFSKIMQAVGALREGQPLLLVAPFEPTPLYAVLGQQGFTHTASQLESGDWQVRFSRGPVVSEARETLAASGSTTARSGAQSQVVDVDARGLEPPQPLVTILEAVAALPDGQELRAHTERRPMHLYAHLQERGFCWETTEQSDGTFITRIRRVA